MGKGVEAKSTLSKITTLFFKILLTLIEFINLHDGNKYKFIKSSNA